MVNLETDIKERESLIKGLEQLLRPASHVEYTKILQMYRNYDDLSVDQFRYMRDNYTVEVKIVKK